MAAIDVQRVWERKIHVRVTLASDEVTSPDAPKPVVEWVPFYSNTDNLARLLYQHFKYCIAPSLAVHKSGEPWERAWFEYKSLKIPGRQLPLGVLAHAHVPPDERPWRLTVHFAGYPDDCCPFKATARKLDLKHMYFNPKHMFFNSVKEALVIMTGKASAITSLVVKQQEAIWGASARGDFAAHADQVQSLSPAACRRPDRATIDVPLRILRGETPVASEIVPAVRFYSRPAVAQRSDGSHPTLLDTLVAIMPDMFQDVVREQVEASNAAADEASTESVPPKGIEEETTLDGLTGGEQGGAAADDQALEPAPSLSAVLPDAPQGEGSVLPSPEVGSTARAEAPVASSANDRLPSAPGQEGASSGAGDAAQSTVAVKDVARAEERSGGAPADVRADAAKENVPDTGAEPAPSAAGPLQCVTDEAGASARWLPEPPPSPAADSAAVSTAATDGVLPAADGQATNVLAGGFAHDAAPRPPKILQATLVHDVVVRVAGYIVPLETPIAALHEAFRAPDFFLYVTVLLPASGSH